jgi:hypothetical protein
VASAAVLAIVGGRTERSAGTTPDRRAAGHAPANANIDATAIYPDGHGFVKKEHALLEFAKEMQIKGPTLARVQTCVCCLAAIAQNIKRGVRGLRSVGA